MKLPCLENPDRPHPYGVEADWRSWFAAAGMPLAEMPPLKSRFATRQLLAMAALAGQGAALLTPEFFRPELDSGRLIQLSPIRLKDVESYYIVCLAGRREAPKIKAFRDWLHQEIALDQAAGVPGAGLRAIGTSASDH